MKLDVLAFGAHPDDVELACAGTLIKLKGLGKKTGIVDLTEGEMGTRGTVSDRYKESASASKIMQLDVRENLNLGDVWFDISDENVLAVVKKIRQYQPTVVFANAPKDRHPDHGRAADLVKKAFFIAGLAKVETTLDGKAQLPFRPAHLFHYIQFRFIEPDVVVDINNEWSKKLEAIKAYKSQFYNPESDEPSTLISSEKFLKFLEARAREFGGSIEKEFGEGFIHSSPVPFDFTNLL